MLLDQSLFTALLERAAQSPRRRAFTNLHQDFSEPVQRVVIAICADSYVPPHRHVEPQQWELFVLLAGSVDFIRFNDTGQITHRQTLTAGSTVTGLELPAGHWHSIVAAPPGAVFLEIKQGPFDPAQPRHFAPFAPTEQQPDASAYLAWLRTAQTGDHSPARQEMVE